MSVTMRDVARRAGVSIKTVSRVVNKQPETSPATRQRVLRAIDELGYRPSKIARALVTQRTDTIGLVMGDISNPFFPEVARGVLDTAQAKGYNVFLGNTGLTTQQELSLLQSLADHAVDGIILHPLYDSQENLTKFAAHYRPLVVINSYFEHPNVSQVLTDNYQGAKLAVDYLIGQGHRAIAMLTGVQEPSADRVRRIKAYCDSLTAHDMPIVDQWLMPNLTPTFESGYESAKQLLTQYPQVSAIFAYNDLLALGAIRACHDLGRHVPNDCAIIGFDDIQWAATATPSLTTVHVDKYELGRQATTRLLDMLNNPKKSFPPIYLDVQLIIRESA
ncbi:MAG: LacI family DNA-binding transcriptional regulator [Ardenticatenaceae bacterium]